MIEPRTSMRFASLVLAGVASVLAILGIAQVVSVESSLLQFGIAGLAGATATLFAAQFAQTINKNPTPLRVALIGPPGAGKTVFLSVLFHELESSRPEGIEFRAYGVDTIEYVSKNLLRLSTGEWPAKTIVGGPHFTFRAVASVNSGLRRRRYTIEIGDLAGESMREFDSGGEAWLHRGDDFKQVVASDAVFLIADGAVLVGERHGQQEMQHALLAALQVFIDEKGVEPGRRISTPVGLIVTKCDLIGSLTEGSELATAALSGLIDIATNRCRHFSVFGVTAVGDLDEGGPPPRLMPGGVVEPLAWALHNVDV